MSEPKTVAVEDVSFDSAQTHVRALEAISFLASQPANPELDNAVQQAKAAGVSPLTVLWIIWAIMRRSK